MVYDISHRQAKAYVGYRRFQTIMSLDILFCGVISKFSLDTLAVWRAREMHELFWATPLPTEFFMGIYESQQRIILYYLSPATTCSVSSADNDA